MHRLVTVLMPARNAQAFIKKSIDSVLKQSYKNIELLIVDDKSIDATRTIIDSFNDPRVRVIDGPGQGISAAFNAGLMCARGDYFCRCDSDDLLPVDRIEQQVSWMSDHADAIAICGAYAAIDHKGRYITQYLKEAHSKWLDIEFQDAKTITHLCTFLIKTDVLKSIGGCRTFFKTAEDIDLQLRLAEKGRIYFMNQCFYKYRLHGLSITHSRPKSENVFYNQFARECYQQRIQFGSDPLQRKENVTIDAGSSTVTYSAESHLITHIISEAWFWHRNKSKFKSLKSIFIGFRIKPVSFALWKNFILILLK